MRICVIGSGYVGLVTAACLADFGNEVTCIEKDQKKLKGLSKGKIEFRELGLDGLIKRNKAAKRLIFADAKKSERSISDADVIFVAVGTPHLKNGAADLSYVHQALKNISKGISGCGTEKFRVIVIKSTVPAGTSDMIERRYKIKNAAIVSNPEFLREGHAVSDFLHPDRIVIGSENKEASNLLSELYRPLNARIVFMSRKSAELTKYAANSFLAARISFINEISNICEKTGADIKQIAEGIGYDKRIGTSYLKAGIGYGGSCLPKDVSALIYTAHKYGEEAAMLKSIDKVNEAQKQRFTKKILKALKKVKGNTVCIWGLSFKAQTDDLRDAPSIPIIKALLEKRCRIRAYDPVSNKKAWKEEPRVKYLDGPYKALKGADVLAVLTEWNEFKMADLAKARKQMNHPVIIDGRDLIDKEKARQAGFYYEGVGTP